MEETEEGIQMNGKEVVAKIGNMISSGTYTADKIEEYQRQLFDNIPHFRSAIGVLDIHNVSRSTVLRNVNDHLLDRAKSEIDSKNESDKKTQKLFGNLLKQNYDTIENAYTRPLVMKVLKKLHTIKDRYLNPILQNDELYNDAPIEVRRHIWLGHPEKFEEEVTPLLHNYCEYRRDQLLNMETLAALSEPPKQRRQLEIMQKLANMIGDSKELYAKALETIRMIYGQSEESALCTIRCELLMTLNDRKLHGVCVTDSAHRFAWCLAACARNRRIGVKHAMELHEFSSKADQQDLTMLLRDPHAVYTICNSIILTSLEAAEKGMMPRDVLELNFLLHLLKLGMGSELNPSGDLGDYGESTNSQRKGTKGRSRSIANPMGLEASLIGAVLPAIAQIQLSHWRNEALKETKIAEEAGSSSKCPSSGIPSLTVPRAYLWHASGRLMVQYHCLVALQREEWDVLKALLSLLPDNRDLVWRPECLQALVVGINDVSDEFVRVELLCLVRPLLPLNCALNVVLYAHTAAMLPTTQNAGAIAERDRCLNALTTALGDPPGSGTLPLSETERPEVVAAVERVRKLVRVDSQPPPSTPRPFYGATPSRFRFSGQMMTPLPSATPFHPGMTPFPGTPMHPGMTPFPGTPMHPGMTAFSSSIPTTLPTPPSTPKSPSVPGPSS